MKFGNKAVFVLIAAVVNDYKQWPKGQKFKTAFLGENKDVSQAAFHFSSLSSY